MAGAIVAQFPVVSRAEAKAQGLKQYFTGNPCKKGHISPRLTKCTHCVQCEAERAVARKPKKQEYRKANAERIAEYSAAYRAANPERVAQWNREARERMGRDAWILRAKVWREENHARALEYDRQYRINNPEKVKEARRKWNQANPDAVVALRNRRKAKKAAGGNYTTKQIIELHKRQRYRCASCGRSTKKERHADHIIPLKLGGSNDITNIQILCPSCNLRKNAKHPIDFAQENGKLL
ncbi:MAG: HNH endonuclease [Pseudomonadota bacterium]